MVSSYVKRRDSRLTRRDVINVCKLISHRVIINSSNDVPFMSLQPGRFSIDDDDDSDDTAFPRRARAIYRSLAFRARPVDRPSPPHRWPPTPPLDSSIMTVRGMRRIQASESAATLPHNWSVIFRPVKIHSGHKGRGSCCCRCSTKDLISDPCVGPPR